jgi:hypothetical protein
VTAYPKTLTDLAGGIKPTPVDALRAAADLAATTPGSEFLKPLFTAAADDADIDLAWSPAPDDRSLDYAWTHYGASCGPIDECPCVLGAVIKAALAFLNIADSAAVTP